MSCLHLVGHRAACPRLIWLYDIILLLEALSDSELECFLSLVRSQKQDTLVCEAISATLPMFESRKVSMVLQRLRHPEGVPVRENYPSLVMRSKFNGMPDLLGKFRILLAHAFPPSR